MYIHEIIIDGFKSYAHRTQVGPFDEQFNAITGLNGSGKSNILDAICFVLGISNLSQVRVSNLQQLIYKKGQAGVRKASVSIVFNNEDRQTSPPGYEQFPTITVTRQVAVGGRNKYLINGHVKQQNQVQNLFRSVQLNVNNPHFLIMQGRITKVLNMKPPEILAMLAEAAGVMLYEAKKAEAQKTMEKKQAKVDEITKVLVEDITPTLETLTKQQKNYDHWTSVKMELEGLQRFLIAYEFFKATKFLEEGAAKQQDRIESLDQMKVQLIESREELKRISEELEEEQRGQGSLKEIEKEVSGLSKNAVAMETSLKHEKEMMSNEKKQLKGAVNSIRELEANISSRTKDLEQKKISCEEKEKENEKWQQSLEDAQREYQAASTGMIVTEDGGDKTLTQELMEKKREVTGGESEIKEYQMRLKHLQGTLKTKRQQLSKGRKPSDLEKEYKETQKKYESLRKKIQAIEFDPEEAEGLRRELQEEEESAKILKRKISDMSFKTGSFQFQYSDPAPKFDRGKVKGLVGTLISIKDLKGVTALEVGAAGRLYQVVVDNEATGKLLLERGQLKKRVTIIPLNKIDSSCLGGEQVKRAQQLVGKENASVALELIDYDSELKPAMKYVFGKFFVCSDSQSAKTVTFDQKIRAKSVTLEGDVYDPSGTVTGGSRSQSASHLASLTDLNDAKRTLNQHEKKIEQLQNSLNSMSKAKGAYSLIEKDISLTSHQLELLKESLNQTEYQRMVLEVEEIEKETEELEQLLEERKEQIAKAKERIAFLEKEIKSAPNKKEDLVKRADSKVKEVKKGMVAASKIYKASVQEAQKIEFEISELKTEHESLLSQKEAISGNLEKIQERYAKASEELQASKKEFEEKNKKLMELKEQVNQILGELGAKKEKLQVEEGDLNEKILKLEHTIGSFAKEKRDSESVVSSILKEHPWVPSEKHLFNRPKTAFDFQSKDIGDTKTKVKELRETEAKLFGSINQKVKDMFETAEQKYKVLKQRIEIIEGDKTKIQKVIDNLDKKKNEALETAFVKVNTDMGKIFETLLPGAVAKLEPIRNGRTLDGLEVKVAFGGVWKESLSELSGGQRSLLALSLILSILLFKPAPMYVLDEIDAALDLSHTQNIGQIIRTHFSKSQFIIVSLKEGMFNNANVLFRVKGVNGISHVTRTEKKKK